MDLVVIAVYIGAMIGIGFYAKGRAKSESDFLVAGRRLGPLLYSGTMAAVVLGGASTIGGVGLGYQYGISGMWLVFSIGCGILLLSLVFAGRINRLGVYTVSQMLELRYGRGANLLSGIVMWAYTLMLAVTSTIAYGTIFGVLFDIGKVPVHPDRRRRRRHLFGARRHVVDHPDRLRPVHHQDHRHLLRAAARGADQGRRLRRTGRKAAGHGVLADQHRRRHDRHLLRHLLLRPGHRPGHLAAGLHRPQRQGRQMGRHRVRRVLPAVRHRRRADRDGRQRDPAGPGRAGRRLPGDRHRGAAAGRRRPGGRRRAGRHHVHLQWRADRHRNGRQGGHRRHPAAAPAQSVSHPGGCRRRAPDRDPGARRGRQQPLVHPGFRRPGRSPSPASSAMSSPR